MKRLNILVVLLVIVFVSLMFAAETQKEKEFLEGNYIRPPEIPKLTLNLSGNKEVYHSSEEMELTTTIESATGIENLTIKVYGIKDRIGNYRVSREKIMNVEPPGTSETFKFRMPSCYGCAGISPGEYGITLETIKDGEIIGNHSLTVKLEG